MSEAAEKPTMSQGSWVWRSVWQPGWCETGDPWDSYEHRETVQISEPVKPSTLEGLGKTSLHLCFPNLNLTESNAKGGPSFYGDPPPPSLSLVL